LDQLVPDVSLEQTSGTTVLLVSGMLGLLGLASLASMSVLACTAS